jgi:crossover junction endodeoxyribonuclease RuvC
MEEQQGSRGERKQGGKKAVTASARPHSSSPLPPCPPAPLRILGLDPGTATTGYGIVDLVDGEVRFVDYGVIETPAGEPAERRLQAIYRQINILIAAHRPQRAAVEQLFFGRNVTTAIAVGQARGVLLLALAEAGIPVDEYSPPKIKEAISGYGKAEKAQMQLMVRHLLDLSETPQPDDAADALAVAITHARYVAFQEAVDAS